MDLEMRSNNGSVFLNQISQKYSASALPQTQSLALIIFNVAVRHLWQGATRVTQQYPAAESALPTPMV
jgi:hypothetical protein